MVGSRGPFASQPKGVVKRGKFLRRGWFVIHDCTSRSTTWPVRRKNQSLNVSLRQRTHQNMRGSKTSARVGIAPWAIGTIHIGIWQTLRLPPIRSISDLPFYLPFYHTLSEMSRTIFIQHAIYRANSATCAKNSENKLTDIWLLSRL
jgi:hypothetical protein